MAIDPQEMAKKELAKAMVPTPDDICEELSPIAALYFLEQLSWATLTLWTAYAKDEQDKAPEVADDLGLTLQGVALAVGSLDEICARIGLIPPAAVFPAGGR